MLKKSEFPSKILSTSHWFCSKICLPWYWGLNKLLSNFISTSDELKDRQEDPCYERFIILCIVIPIYLGILILWLPLLAVALPFKLFLQTFRCPYVYSYRENHHERHPDDFNWMSETRNEPCFHISSVNTCLLPEALSRINNLRNVKKRAHKIAAYITNSQVRPNPKIFVQSPTNTDLKILSVCSSIMDQTNSNSLLLNQSQWTNSGDDVSDDVFVVAQVSYPSGSRIQRNRTVSDSATVVKGRPFMEQNDSEADYSPLSRINEGLSFSSMDTCKSATCGSIRNKNFFQKLIRSDVHMNELTRPPNPLPSATSASAFFESNPSVSLRECGLNISETFSTNLTTETDHLQDFSREIITDFEHALSINFPPEMDFLCLQEVFDTHASNYLIRSLQVYFSYVLTGVGVSSWSANKFLLSSGLVIASRYPIIDADFKYFTHKEKEDKAICKGLLMAKVHVGTTMEGRRVVGFISTTQLQSTQDCETRSLQMTQILSWLNSFRCSVTSQNELIVLDVLTGNFNFDNMSPRDIVDFNHPLFSIYQDPCRQLPGLDHSWTVGTVLKSSTLHDKEVSTPEGLQRVLEDGYIRGKYIEDLEVYLSSANSIMPSNLKEFQRYKGNGRRRVDFILYNNENTHYQQLCDEFHFITQLTSLTDHIPLSMVFTSTMQDPATWPVNDDVTEKDEIVFYESSVDIDVHSDLCGSNDSWT